MIDRDNCQKTERADMWNEEKDFGSMFEKKQWKHPVVRRPFLNYLHDWARIMYSVEPTELTPVSGE
jgi:hypothetical protein